MPLIWAASKPELEPELALEAVKGHDLGHLLDPGSAWHQSITSAASRKYSGPISAGVITQIVSRLSHPGFQTGESRRAACRVLAQVPTSIWFPSLSRPALCRTIDGLLRMVTAVCWRQTLRSRGRNVKVCDAAAGVLSSDQ